MTFHPHQRRLIAVAWLTYAAYYLCRVNIATAIPDLEVSLDLTKSQIGLLGSAGIWAYAVGALLNGQLGDRLSPRRFIFTGMVASAAFNIAFGLASTWWLLFIFWLVNGYFQATGWGPILRILANWLTPDQRRQISGGFGSSFVAGNALTWLFSGWLVANFGWQMGFWGPAILMFLFAVGWYLLARDTPEQASEAQLQMAEVASWGSAEERQHFWPTVVASIRRLWTLLVAAAFSGFIFSTFIVWTPTYYVEVGNLGVNTASTLAALLPLAGIGGTLLIGWFVARYMAQREVLSLGVILFVLAGLFLLYPFLSFRLVFSTIILMVGGSIVYGASSLLLSTMTLTLEARSETSSTAGLLDFSFALGSGLSGVLIGAILDVFSWNAVFYALASAAFLAAVFITITIVRLR